MTPLYIALIHYPVVNKHGELVTTSITNFDIHDLARTGKTFGVQQCFFVTPNVAQQNMVAYIKKYWREGLGASFNPDRNEAFEIVEISESLEETRLTIQKRHGIPPRLIATTAKGTQRPLSFSDLRQLIQKDLQPVLLMFGTGWGLAPEVLNQVDGILEPIKGFSDYNHLPVRSAVAIVLDRLINVGAR